MAGPLDFLTSDDAQMGLAMLAAAGPTATPMSFGQRLAGGMQQAQAMQTAREDRKLKQLLTNAQIQQLQAETAQKTGLMAAAGGLFGGTPSASGGGMVAPPQAGLLAPDGQPAPQGSPAGLTAGPGSGTAAPTAPAAPGSLKGVPFGRITMLAAMGGKDLTEQWKLENLGTPIPAGSWIRMADGTERYQADPTKGRTVDAQGNVGLMPGYLPSLAAETAVTKGIEAQEAARLAEGTPVYDTDPNSPTYGKKIIKSRLDMLGGGQGGPAPAPAAPARNLLSPGGYAGGSSSAAADGQRQTLLAELPKAQQEVAKAQQSGDAAAAARAQGDMAAIQKELARLPGGARAAPVNLLTPTPARAPAANVVELSPQETAVNKANEAAASSLAGETGKMLQASAEKANTAVQSVGTAQRLQQAIDSDKTFVGPGATSRLRVAQVSSLLGVPGKNDEERTANTRIAMQEMAKLTMAGRQQMSGQGAVTEGENALAMRASSGNIEDFTAAEIKILAGAAERSARWQHQQHQNKLAALAKNPAAASQLGIYAVDPLPPPLEGNRMDPFAPASRAFKGIVGAPGSAAPAPRPTMTWEAAKSAGWR